MSTGSHTHHHIDYLEFTVTDMAAAKRFYGDAFGWEFTEYGPEYAGIKWGDTEIGGFRSDMPVRSGGVMVVLYSTDLDDTMARIKKAGGLISTDPYEFPGGRRFHFTDTSGNELAVWSEQ